MAQVVVWARHEHLDRHRAALSDAIHGAVMAALDYPADKRFHRFVGLADEDFVYPSDRGGEARRRLITELFDRLQQEIGIAPHGVEITITETPRVNWGIRGRNAADLDVGYRVDV
jgi:hypothetical protein